MWILFVVLMSNTDQMTTTEFETKASCLAAQKKLEVALDRKVQLVAFCALK